MTFSEHVDETYPLKWVKIWSVMNPCQSVMTVQCQGSTCNEGAHLSQGYKTANDKDFFATSQDKQIKIHIRSLTNWLPVLWTTCLNLYIEWPTSSRIVQSYKLVRSEHIRTYSGFFLSPFSWALESKSNYCRESSLSQIKWKKSPAYLALNWLAVASVKLCLFYYKTRTDLCLLCWGCVGLRVR